WRSPCLFPLGKLTTSEKDAPARPASQIRVWFDRLRSFGFVVPAVHRRFIAKRANPPRRALVEENVHVERRRLVRSRADAD
ncbi:hypothetical protein, partial [Aurantimonas coralicida]|uniref:hypothetical protein n=1 Tax=Aurantimonas coralicida TaxID=182270 RepID=UPI001E34595E